VRARSGIRRCLVASLRSVEDSAARKDPHRHGRHVHAHAHQGPHRHLPPRFHRSRPLSDPPAVAARRNGYAHRHAHGAHGLIDESIKRSRAGIRAVALSLAVLGSTALAQAAIFIATDSIALLADLIHNFGDALTALPLGIAFALRSNRAERGAGLFVVLAIFISACLAGVEAVRRLIHPVPPDHLAVLAAAGAIGYAGNYVAAQIRTRAGRTLQSAALIADGNHARVDAYVSLAVVASVIVVALGAPIADPLIGLAITGVILRITWQSWLTVSGRAHSH
jgi:Co/Zn/Cd efflux system component